MGETGPPSLRSRQRRVAIMTAIAAADCRGGACRRIQVPLQSEQRRVAVVTTVAEGRIIVTGPFLRGLGEGTSIVWNGCHLEGCPDMIATEA